MKQFHESIAKYIGGTLLIIGTSIGGGMLALPIVLSKVGFANTFVALIFCWFIMTLGALFILEVCAQLPTGTNLISMSRYTLGPIGAGIAWISYLFLLYSLLSGYIAGGSDIIYTVSQSFSFPLSDPFQACIFTLLCSVIVYRGIETVDYVNRGLMFGKLSIYLILLVLISPFIQSHQLSVGSIHAIPPTLTTLISAYGFATIVPSLRDYFHNDLVGLRKMILWGSCIPLICYIFWNAVIMGVIPAHGAFGLVSLMHDPHATSTLGESLSHVLHTPWIIKLFNFFTSICILTAFLAVSTGLFDFLADGLSLKKQGSQGFAVFLLTFAPPLAIVLLKPDLYLLAFRFAGVACIILLLLLPALMVWRGRKTHKVWTSSHIPGGYFTVYFLIASSLFMLYIAIKYEIFLKMGWL
ncbi:MAG: aromatic amino acid transport family protein [Legionellaceae bacterium]|nr:aromatic amino acid transport family protein [Legionellaceae bacterium]